MALIKEKEKNLWETRAVKEVKGVAFWQVLTLQGNNEEEIVSEGEWQAVASTGWDPGLMQSLQGEREEGRSKKITLKWGGGGKEGYCMQNQRSEQQYRQETTMTEGRHFGSLFILFAGAVNGGGGWYARVLVSKARCPLGAHEIVVFRGHTSSPVLLGQD